MLVDSGNPGHLFVEKELTASSGERREFARSACCDFVAQWLERSTKSSEDPGSNPVLCKVFFCLVQLSVLLSLSEEKERIWTRNNPDKGEHSIGRT